MYFILHHNHHMYTTSDIIITGWWFQLLWKIWKSIGMMTFPIYGQINKCSKPPLYSIDVVHVGYVGLVWIYRPKASGWCDQRQVAIALRASAIRRSISVLSKKTLGIYRTKRGDRDRDMKLMGCMHVYIYIWVYMYKFVCICICVYIYISVG